MIAALLFLVSFPPAWSGILVPQITVVPAEHYTDLTWQDTNNPSGTSYNIYKAIAVCSDSSASYQKIVSGIQSGPSGLSYRDSAVVAGQTVCYYVTAVVNTVESIPSNKAEATTPSAKRL